MKKHIHNLFKEWGQSERELPANHKELRSEVIYKLNPDKFIPVKKRRLPWLPMTLAGSALVVLLVTHQAVNFLEKAYDTSTGREASVPNLPTTPSEETFYEFGGASDEDAVAPGLYTPPQKEIPITDTREFLKTDYYANIKTRKVEEFARRVETTIRGLGGRIDNSSKSQQHASINFALPATEFEALREEIGSLTFAKLITEDIQTTNLLPQKQAVENSLDWAQDNLAELKNSRQRIIRSHSQTVSSIQSRLSEIARQLAELEAADTGDPEEKKEVSLLRESLIRESQMLSAEYREENSSYSRQLSQVDRRIRSAEGGLKNFEKQDQDLINTVATVQGRVVIQRASVWEILWIYISPYWVSALLLAAAIVTYIVHRRRLRIELP